MVRQFLNSMIVFVLIIGLGLGLSPQALAQGTSQGTERSRAGSGPRRQIATIIFSGLGGAILGLSTLSFYGRPQDKLSNIAVGFAIGVIAGTSFVTYKAATRPDEFYGVKPQIEQEFDPISGRDFGLGSGPLAGEPSPPVLQLGWAFDF